MPLRLDVPPLEEKPAAAAETRPSHIQELVAALPLSNPRAAAKLLLEHLAPLNRQRISVDARLTALELFRPALLDITHGLSRQYCNQPLPLQETARAQAELAQELFTELAFGYKQALLAEEDKLFNLGGNNQIALLLQRALDALSRLLQTYYQIYAPAPKGVWSELHLLYLHALQLSLQDLAVPDEPAERSINLVYKHALLLSLADPRQLASTDLERVIDYIDRFANLAQLHPLGTPDTTKGIFLVHLKSDKPPVPLAKNTREADMRTDILLITIELARQVYTHLSLLNANEPPASINLPEIAHDQRYRDMLQHLLRLWGNPPKRAFQRAEKRSTIQICSGIAAIHHFLARETAHAAKQPDLSEETPMTLSFANSPIDSGGGAIFKAARWMMVNESAGGLALSTVATSQAALRVGELLGLKPDDTSNWGLAAVRWATSRDGDNAPLDIGAQMLAPTAKAVNVCPPEQTKPEPSLLLPELAALKQPASLIAARGLYKPARTLVLEEDGKRSNIMLTRLVERTNSFERFQFSRL